MTMCNSLPQEYAHNLPLESLAEKKKKNSDTLECLVEAEVKWRQRKLKKKKIRAIQKTDGDRKTFEQLLNKPDYLLQPPCTFQQRKTNTQPYKTVPGLPQEQPNNLNGGREESLEAGCEGQTHPYVNCGKLRLTKWHLVVTLPFNPLLSHLGVKYPLA